MPHGEIVHLKQTSESIRPHTSGDGLRKEHSEGQTLEISLLFSPSRGAMCAGSAQVTFVESRESCYPGCNPTERQTLEISLPKCTLPIQQICSVSVKPLPRHLRNYLLLLNKATNRAYDPAVFLTSPRATPIMKRPAPQQHGEDPPAKRPGVPRLHNFTAYYFATCATNWRYLGPKVLRMWVAMWIVATFVGC